MKFPEFAKRLYSAISGGKKTVLFTRELFESIVDENGLGEIDETKDYSFKNYYNGTNSISGIAKKINAYVDSEKFETYIESKGDAAATTLAKVFKNEIPDAEPANISQKLGDLFVQIILEAVGNTKAHKQSSLFQSEADDFLFEILDKKRKEGRVYSEDDLLTKYYNNASEYFSTKKTLLYAETPHPFYEMYVCNSISVRNRRLIGNSIYNENTTIDNVSLEWLENNYRYVIIQGTGGIGKSMFLTHLFLSYDEERKNRAKTPILIQLKDYARPNEEISELILDTVKVYNSDVTLNDIISKSLNGEMILLLDGLDEIPTELRVSYNKALEDYIKSYQSINIIMTSRPVNSFVSYTKFELLSINELTKKQSLELVSKLEFWDVASKDKFLNDLDKRLYETHHQFASNPLLLTIMLMTYSSYADVPAKMHHFYAQAYETMARLHDASKGAYIRPLNTQLTPEEFSDYFSQFCARSYSDEVYEFNVRSFTEYMKSVIRNLSPDKHMNPKDFLLDLTDNLCIMYREGERIYFIHRSFQEYFAALFFSTYYDEKLKQLGSFFEKKRSSSTNEIAFDMLYDMIPEKIDRYVFFPYLNKWFSEQTNNTRAAYWNILFSIYERISFYYGDVLDVPINEPDSFIYEKIVSYKGFKRYDKLDSTSWPSFVYDSNNTKRWYEVYSHFLNTPAYKKEYVYDYDVPTSLLKSKRIVEYDMIPEEYYDLFGNPEEVGAFVEYNFQDLFLNANDHPEFIALIENDSFPLKQEFLLVKDFWQQLLEKEKVLAHSDSLFDD